VDGQFGSKSIEKIPISTGIYELKSSLKGSFFILYQTIRTQNPKYAIAEAFAYFGF